jgi:hypothetical protein
MGLVGAALLAFAAMVPQTGSAVVDAFVADVLAGRRGQAAARVTLMNAASGRADLVATAREMVNILARCTLTSVRETEPTMYFLIWRCPGGDHRLVLNNRPASPRLIVAQFDTLANIAARRPVPVQR